MHNGSPYYRDWSPSVIKPRDTNNDESFPDHQVVAEVAIRCVVRVGKNYNARRLDHWNSFKLSPRRLPTAQHPIRIQYTTGYITDIHPERVYQHNTWCLRDEQPYTIGPDGILSIGPGGLRRSIQNSKCIDYNSINYIWRVRRTQRLSKNNTKRLDKAATEIQRMLRGRYFHKNLLPLRSVRISTEIRA